MYQGIAQEIILFGGRGVFIEVQGRKERKKQASSCIDKQDNKDFYVQSNPARMLSHGWS